VNLFNLFLKNSTEARKLYLHAGTHKTGTTAIQEFAFAHRRSLKRRGLLYPGYSPLIRKTQNAHHWFAHALADNQIVPLSPDSVPLLTRRWLSKARRKHADVFVSVEALYRHVVGEGPYEERRRRYLIRVAEALEGFDVHVIIVFRRPDNYIRSVYQERVMRAARPLPPFVKFYQSAQKGRNYYLNAKLFQEVFPALTCLIYEDLDSSANFFTRFFNAMNIDVSGLDGVGVVRKSLSPAETLVKNFANRYLEDRKAGKVFLRWMRSPKTASRIRGAYGGTAYDLWPSHAARQEFLDSRQEDMEKLRLEFFPGRERLFPPLREGDTAPPVPPLPPELKKLVLEYFGKKSE
jgi:hypothetical protein